MCPHDKCRSGLKPGISSLWGLKYRAVIRSHKRVGVGVSDSGQGVGHIRCQGINRHVVENCFGLKDSWPALN